ncbi:MAG: LON peptidase substrate-binding domain-containing protein [Hyphomonas sp.]|nr:LON peptidase substrate-binding domain-containing protein [Hyphomonas sp.]
MSAADFRSIDDMPGTLAVFPLPGVMLFPRWPLPLNIFEPRYLNMVDDAMASDRLIGMVQSTGGDRQKPDIAGVGCAGRIAKYAETSDGRYLITLQGVCRFRIEAELDLPMPYRQVRPDWQPFALDFREESFAAPEIRDDLLGELRTYLDANELEADWDTIEESPLEAIVNGLAASLPFSVTDKQDLLEAQTLALRAGKLAALLHLDSAGPGNAGFQ